jgi:hypothetical protein
MKIFKELKNLGYIHYSATTIEELDDLPLNSAERISEQALVLRWFREKYGLKHDIDDDNVGTKFYYKIRSYTDKFDNYYDIIKHMREERDWSKIEFYSYEEAELECLKKLIEIAKNK